jgi:hypothetical protein
MVDWRADEAPAPRDAELLREPPPSKVQGLDEAELRDEDAEEEFPRMPALPRL